MTTPEGKVKNDIRKWLAARCFHRAADERPEDCRGWYYQPQNMGMGVNGIPDFVGSVYRDSLPLIPYPFAIEAKAPGEKPTPIQEERIAEMRAAGWFVLVVDDVNQLTQLEEFYHG